MRLFTCRYSCTASTAVTSSGTRHNQTHKKGAYRRKCVIHSQHVDVFNSNGEAYENAWDLPPPPNPSSPTGCRRGGQGHSKFLSDKKPSVGQLVIKSGVNLQI